MNRNSIDKEVYLLLSSFLAEVHAFSTNRSTYVELTNLGSDIKAEKNILEEYENLVERNASDREMILMDMRDLSRAKILKKYYRLLLILDHVKHANIIRQLDFLFECFSSAIYDIQLVPDIGCLIRDLIDDIKLNRLQTSR